MALNIEMLKEPKYLIIGGVAVVGGIYFASKLNSRKKSEEPVEITPAVQSVVSTDTLNQTDDLQRRLSDAEQKQADLIKAQEDKDRAYAESSAETERRLGSQYGAQISSLQALIENLRKQIAIGFDASKFGYNPPSKVQPTPTAPKTPVPQTPAPNVPRPPIPATPMPLTVYPGVGNGDLPENTYTGLHGSYEQVLANQKGKGQNNTFTMRNMSAIALYGTPTPWLFTGTWNLPEAINQRRINFGLRPLTATEIQQMLGAAGNSKDGILNDARGMFNKWNLPYQSGASVKRF